MRIGVVRSCWCVTDDPDDLGECVGDAVDFELVRNVGVDSVESLESVMVHVVRLERLGGGQASGEVRQNGSQAIERILVRAAPAQIVRQLVDGQLQRMIRRAADHVRARQQHVPLCIAHEVGHAQLQQQQRKRQPKRQRLRHEQISDLHQQQSRSRNK